ncbi:hypothetical protein ACIQNT_27610 [Streptomyces luteogriseus]|uniref:hypothetical protein n=1 Tax=Streptomyces luteogriseus TaxID=68233 RepID=UPI0037FAF055
MVQNWAVLCPHHRDPGDAAGRRTAPAERRGFWSGLLQSGYSPGYLLAAVAFLVIEPVFGRRSGSATAPSRAATGTVRS